MRLARGAVGCLVAVVLAVAACSSPSNQVPVVAMSSVPVSPPLGDAGVTRISDYAISVPQGQELMVVRSAPGKLVYGLATPDGGGSGVAAGAAQPGPAALVAMNTSTGSTQVIGPVHPGWGLQNFAVEGSNLVWVESQRGPDSSCDDPSFGCVSWAMYAEDLSVGNAVPAPIAHEDAFVPLRGVPIEPRTTDGVVCWATSTDSKVWTLWRSSVSHPDPLVAGSSQRWIRWCDTMGGLTLATQWKVRNGIGDGDLIGYRSGRATLITSGAQDFARSGQEVAFSSQPSPDGGRNVSLLALDAPSHPRLISSFGDVNGFGWTRTGQVWVLSADGLGLWDAETAREQAPLGEGSNPWSVSSNGDQLVWIYGSPTAPVVRVVTLK